MSVTAGRFTASYSGPLVVFIIGMRINKLRKIGKWLPVIKAMSPMIAELQANPDSGFLGVQRAFVDLRTVLLIQYWRDFDGLEAYARDREQNHWPAWNSFNKAVGNDGTVGIYHETYCVGGGAYETIYANMPPFGLGTVSGVVAATGSRDEARSRMRMTAK